MLNKKTSPAFILKKFIHTNLLEAIRAMAEPSIYDDGNKYYKKKESLYGAIVREVWNEQQLDIITPAEIKVEEEQIDLANQVADVEPSQEIIKWLERMNDLAKRLKSEEEIIIADAARKMEGAIMQVADAYKDKGVNARVGGLPAVDAAICVAKQQIDKIAEEAFEAIQAKAIQIIELEEPCDIKEQWKDVATFRKHEINIIASAVCANAEVILMNQQASKERRQNNARRL